MINAELQYVDVNGLTYAYYEQGQGDHYVFCFHGFPDTPHTWEHLIPHLVDAGYHVIAPYIRGYPPTGIPSDGQYSADKLAEDVIGLMDALNIEKAWLIGHDWGSSFVYSASALAPERFHKMVTITSPHINAINWTPRVIWRVRHILAFQHRSSAIRWMKKDNFQAIATLFNRWSPNWDFTEEDVDMVRQCFSTNGGLEGALGYYWSFVSGFNNEKAQGLLRKKTTVPTLLLLGEEDGAFAPRFISSFDKAFDAPYEVVELPTVGHFLHREVPDKVAQLVLNFFGTPNS